MPDHSLVTSFQPSTEWLEDWPYDLSTLVRVGAVVGGTAAEEAVSRFLKDLHRAPDADVPEGVEAYFWGGYSVDVSRIPDDTDWMLILASAGEDGFSSALGAAESLYEAVRATAGDVELDWMELPPVNVDASEA
ncbi:hypothetical protein [Falsarthrobacter nasiphocae]|uniref:Uncharacterized protein n=1 Tax=Falsarthrobacter nasiphocae TaxID=189863 RepID=A0AAE4C7K6_9MICC|nr:hypothetical protein [Falsarthrobacter nasiphocae]MDR6891535.1 hypothetical protein [Falsarthrobacter nasiphocae]